MAGESDIFSDLMDVIAQRRRHMPPESYTTKLLRGGVPKIGQKIREEAAEVIEAAEEAERGEGSDHLVYEAGDLIYHLFVLLGRFDISLEQIQAELVRRFGTSGLAEKASRSDDPGECE